MMKKFTELDVGYSNADNYQRRENRQLLSRYFVRDEFLDRLLNPDIYYLVGEKGTGKTAYATYLNISSGNTVSILNVRQTEYQKFLELKRQGQLTLSNYSDVWRTLLLIAVSSKVLETSGTPDFLKRFTKLKGLKDAINEFYDQAFAPEIVQMLNFVESSEIASKLIAKHSGLSADLAASNKFETRSSASIFQTNLLKIRRAFEAAVQALKLDDDLILFIDGIDVRPAAINYADYFDCVQGLIEAIWSINNDFLANIKDSKGRIRVILLVRPDIFLRSGLHNLNTKLRDNSVFLNWMTTYKDYRSSLMFKVADRLLAAQQDRTGLKEGDAWDYYFPFQAENVRAEGVSGERQVNSFLSFLRFSYYRPRDISSMIKTMQEIVRNKKGACDYVSAEDFSDPTFRDSHAEYLLGEIRDQLLFYYSQDEFELFLQFFAHLRGKRKFSYSDYVDAFNEFIDECSTSGKVLPQFFDNADAFLQFLYEQNVVSYKEKDALRTDESEVFIRWCFRERTFANMAPKVRKGVEYEIFYGLSKALNVGRPIRISTASTTREIGTVSTLQPDKGFGFIRGGKYQNDYYFKLSDSEVALKVGQKVSFEPVIKYGKQRARDVRTAR